MSAGRVLVVDDSADITAILTLTLRRAGLQVATAGDGVDALAKLEAELPDVVLLDVMMPRMDGLETLRRIRGNPRTVHLPIIMLTAKAQLADKMAGFERGADDYVAKPFDPAELLARVQSLLERTEQARLTSPLLTPSSSSGGEHRRVPPRGGPMIQAGKPIVVRVSLAFIDLVPAFLDNTRRETAAVRAALEQGDWETVRLLGHRLRGSSGVYGFHRVSEIAAAVQDAAVARNAAAARARVADLEDYLRRLRVVPAGESR
jgi:DNA-binding response OmpR family regulator